MQADGPGVFQFVVDDELDVVGEGGQADDQTAVGGELLREHRCYLGGQREEVLAPRVVQGAVHQQRRAPAGSLLLDRDDLPVSPRVPVSRLPRTRSSGTASGPCLCIPSARCRRGG